MYAGSRLRVTRNLGKPPMDLRLNKFQFLDRSYSSWFVPAPEFPPEQTRHDLLLQFLSSIHFLPDNRIIEGKPPPFSVSPHADIVRHAGRPGNMWNSGPRLCEPCARLCTFPSGSRLEVSRIQENRLTTQVGMNKRLLNNAFNGS